MQDHSSTTGSHHVLVRAQRPSGNERHILYFASGQPCNRRRPHSSAGDDEAISAVQLHEHTYRLPFAGEAAVDRRWTGSCMRPTSPTFLRHANILQTESPEWSCCFARACNQLRSQTHSLLVGSHAARSSDSQSLAHSHSLAHIQTLTHATMQSCTCTHSNRTVTTCSVKSFHTIA